MTHSFDWYQIGPWNFPGERLAMLDGEQRILSPVKDERRRRGDFAGRADAILTCDRMTLHELGSRTLTVREAIDDDRLTLTGDTKAVHPLFRAVRKA